ncbi:T9SS type A sorting domain-containing protein [Flavobacterium capsici]|uniref:T9SS type A sorting domain-containing protein n=1 Tax=Flavobacterium capsici TaxID=3075618 RepID=A0AA96F362_9FLAO|nr:MULTISPECIES: T9SS type A sorting domain-containing protein [unclassified Flavobacterium]WNM18111.1 T9SS type A sorting domain-containing protein [Flavobacterium sp. PMR2A8]WNM22163.1 T9SS type A sorting domain-containing protein [Flavobacterium sp. PMTSA4]
MKNIYFLLFTQVIFSQLQLASFYPTSGASGGFFGSSMAIDGNEIVSSTVSINGTLTQVGKVYVFNKIGNQIIQSQTLFENDVLHTDVYGNSVDIENDRIAVGAPRQGLNSSNTGAVYMYKKVNGNYQFHQKILSITNDQDDRFGTKVKIFNNRLYIGSNNNFYVYDLVNDDWILSQTITLPNVNSLGFAKILVSNNQLLISSLSNGLYYNTFELSNNQWVYQNSQNFNTSLGLFLYDSKIYVVQPQQFLINIYEFSNDNWVLNSSFNYTPTDQMFDKIVVNDSNIFLGSNSYILQMARKFPVKYFKKDNNNWLEQPNLYGQEPFSGFDDYFGSNIILEGDSLIIAATFEYSFVPVPTGRSYYADTTLSLNDNIPNSFYFYPNPTKDFLHLEDSFINEVRSISVFQIDGKMINTINSNFESIDLRNLTKGVYFLKILFNNDSIITKKVIKN